MKRKIYNKLLAWKLKSNGSTALLIDGARRVGKSYIVEEFAKNEYASYVLVDFSKAQTKLKRIFNEYLDDLDTFFLYFERITHSRLVRGNALVIFDEVQKFPRAREAIKHLVADGRYHYIETGSLISINKNVKDILIPSEEHRIPMYPMDFEEFLWAMGDTVTMPLVRKRFADMKPLGADVHRQIMDVFRQYMIVGGMPQAVAKFAATRDLEAVDSVKRDILALYRADIHKYGGVLRHKAASVFNAIPSQLSRHEKRLVLSEVRAGGRMRDFESTFDWLESAMTINVCRRASEPNVGLELAADRQSVKCYMGDTGLLVSHAFGENELAAKDIHNRLLLGDIELNEGMIVENVVAQMIRAAGHALYFFSDSDRESAKDRMEIDFLLAKSRTERKRNVSPIEVKSGKRYSTVSLNKFRAKYKRFLDVSYVLHPKDLKTDGDIKCLPLYMAPLLVAGR
ncbi:MAG: ATP-binding protein [Kiritimatiellae bacterium]|nr:ATP-binding protein [Kiritimatiellia bacterium]MBQ3345197.1 ATP-binding protein [Kiritimatiellia bacterium]